jgi:membrane-associated phospholipid phosphatase
MIGSLHIASRDFIARWKSRHRFYARNTRRMEAGLALVLCLTIVTVAVYGDETIARSVKLIARPFYDFFATITRLGDSGWIFATCATCLVGALALRHRGWGKRVDAMLGLFAGRAFFVLAVNAVSGLLSIAFKMFFGRARPRLLDMVGPFHFDMFSWKSSVLSFPSGHSVTAFATVTALAFMAPRLGSWLFVLAVLIAASRVITGAHYPSDVIAGAALGTATVIVMRRAFAARQIVFRSRENGIEARGAGLISTAFAGVFGLGVKK